MARARKLETTARIDGRSIAGLSNSQTANDVDEHVILSQLRIAMPLQDGEQQIQAILIDTRARCAANSCC